MSVITYTVFLALFLAPPPRAPEGIRGPGMRAGEFSVAILPDMQHYTYLRSDLFAAQTRWIAENASAYNIQMVLHEGDVVQRDQPYEWALAADAWEPLEMANLPYLVALGNHEQDAGALGQRLSTRFNTLFSQARYTAHDWWDGGFYEAGRTENAYLLRTIGGVDYLFLTLEYGPRDEVLRWAGEVLTTHAGRKAMLVTHSYLYGDGTRVGPGDADNPKLALGPGANDGEDIWQELVRWHPNVFWVQSGHHLNGNSAYRLDETVGGTCVHQMFANYQQLPNGGDGWLRLVTFGPDYARVRTYSPAPGALRAGSADNFTVTLSCRG